LARRNPLIFGGYENEHQEWITPAPEPERLLQKEYVYSMHTRAPVSRI